MTSLKIELIGKITLLNHVIDHRYPFIAADVLTSSLKIAEALVPIKQVPDQEDSESDTTGENTATQSSKVETDEIDSEVNAIQKVLDKAQETKSNKKHTLVEDLEEIDMDDQDNFEAILRDREDGVEDVDGATKGEGSRNSFTDKKDEDEEEDDEVNVDEDEG